MLAERLDFVIGVDSHRDAHALALVRSPGGAAVLSAEVAADERGYQRALALACEHAPGRRAWAIEGAGAYGKGLARHLQARGELVLEAERPHRSSRRGRAKSDALDALEAARSPLAGEPLASRRRGGAREALRSLLSTRESAIQARRCALNQVRALLVTCPEPLREELRSLTRARLLARCRALRPGPAGDPELAGTRLALSLLATRIELLTREERLLLSEIRSLVSQLAPALLTERGVGPISAAQVLVSWSIGDASAARPASPVSAAHPRSRSPRERACATGSTGAATASSTGRSTRSSSAGASATRQPPPTSPAESARARASGKRSALSSATSPATSSDSWRQHRHRLDTHRSIPGHVSHRRCDCAKSAPTCAQVLGLRGRSVRTLSCSRRSRDRSSGRDVRLRHAGGGVGTERTSGRRAPCAAPP
jgi:hypothetical protein